jgi:PmbA protein
MLPPLTMKIEREFAQELMRLALDRGADEAETFIGSSKNLSIEIKDQQIDALESSLTVGYSLRVIKDKKLGFSYSTDKEAAVSVAEKAVEAARWVDRDEYLGFPEPSEPGKVEIFDPELISVSEEEAIRKVSLLEKAAYDEDRRIKTIRRARGTFRNSEIVIMNSMGVDRQYSSTTCTAQIMAMADNECDSRTGWYFTGSRFLNEISFDGVGRNAARRSLQLLGSKRMNAQKAPVILDNLVAVEFMGIFASSLSSESVQKGKSLLAAKIGKKIISPKINIIDNGLIPGKLGSTPVDDEGVSSQNKILIREGILSGYLYNTYTAKKEGVLSTGNAVRSSFAGLPSVGISNLYVEAVSNSNILHIADIFKAVDKCLYVTEAMGVHTANPITGEFSVGVSGVWIEKGEEAFPVKEAVISGNILSFFENIEAVGDDLMFFGNMGSPSLLLGPTDISA